MPSLQVLAGALPRAGTYRPGVAAVEAEAQRPRAHPVPQPRGRSQGADASAVQSLAATRAPARLTGSPTAKTSTSRPLRTRAQCARHPGTCPPSPGSPLWLPLDGDRLKASGSAPARGSGRGLGGSRDTRQRPPAASGSRVPLASLSPALSAPRPAVQLHQAEAPRAGGSSSPGEHWRPAWLGPSPAGQLWGAAVTVRSEGHSLSARSGQRPTFLPKINKGCFCPSRSCFPSFSRVFRGPGRWTSRVGKG